MVQKAGSVFVGLWHVLALQEFFPAELGECCTLDLPGEGTETLQTTADTKHSQAHLPEIPESQNLRIC